MPATQQRLESDPDYWWIRLSTAMRRGDLEAAAEAQKRLSELGVDVRFRRVSASAERDDIHA